MAQLLTVKEATRFTGKSESTIKRLIREVTDDSEHPDRHFITPPHDEVVQRREAGEPYVWKVDETLLAERYKQDDSGNASSPSINSSGKSPVEPAGDRIINVLEETVDVLKNELGEKNRQIDGLQERLREQNLLTKNLQDQLLLVSPANSRKDTPDSEPIIIDTPSTSEEGSDRAKSSSSSSKQRQQAKKASIWHREFHLFGPMRRK